jgi:hypothetical protein
MLNGSGRRVDEKQDERGRKKKREEAGLPGRRGNGRRGAWLLLPCFYFSVFVCVVWLVWVVWLGVVSDCFKSTEK